MKTCIALTGGIATGKSTISKLFEDLGIEVIDTDHIARELTTKPEIVTQILNKFGDEVLTSNTLDRQKLRELIFSDATAKEWLQNLLHPQIRIIANNRAQASSSTYCIIAIPLLYKRESYNIQRVCVTDCKHAIQVARLCKRDNISVKQAEQIINQQPSAAERMSLADDVIDTNGCFQELKQQIDALHKRYIDISLNSL